MADRRNDPGYSQEGYPPMTGGGPPPPGYVGGAPAYPGPPPPGYAGAPPPGYVGGPPQGYPGAAPQGYPPQGYPPQGYPPQGAPPPGYAPPVNQHPHAHVPGAPIMVQPAVPANTSYHVLSSVPQLFIKQKVDLLEVITGWEVQNKYGIHLSKADQEHSRKWLQAKEDSNCFCRLLFNPRHELKMKVGFPDDGPKILEGERPCAWCVSHMKVKDHHNDQIIGELDQDCMDLMGCCGTTVHVKSKDGHEMFKIVGPSPCYIQLCMMFPCRDPLDFEVIKDGKKTGAMVQNVPNGCLKMFFTSADDYVITFEEKSSAEERAMMLMYTFLLDYMYFQAKQQRNNNNNFMS